MVTRLKWKLVLVHWEIVLILTQDRCMACARRTMAQNLFWTHSMVPLGDEAQVEACFGLCGDSANVVTR